MHIRFILIWIETLHQKNISSQQMLRRDYKESYFKGKQFGI